MNTVGKDKGVYPTAAWKKKILLAEHSPIRLMQFAWKWSDLPYWVSVHIVRHKIGIEHFVSTQRTDRTGVDRTERPQNAPVLHQCQANAQALITISRKRLCSGASAETRQAWQLLKDEIAKVEPELASCMVRECVYRGFCPEMYGCGFDKTEEYKKSSSATTPFPKCRNNENAFSGRRRRFRYQRSLAEFAPAGAKNGIIFSGDMCVGENTLRLANVRAQASALRRAAAPSNESVSEAGLV